MAKIIAVTGKGGTGKTVVAALIIKYLKQHASGPLLAIDADPDRNLSTVLGVAVEQTIGDLREETLEKIKSIPAGMSKSDYIEAGLHQIIVETEKVDFVTMGRAEGPGCYCFINSLLRKFSDGLQESYEWVVMDNLEMTTFTPIGLTGTGPEPVTFPVPLVATPGPTFIRFRYSTLRSGGPGGNYEDFGFAPDGEVEDYEIEILPPETGLLVTKLLDEPASGIATIGETVTFTIRIENTGSVTVSTGSTKLMLGSAATSRVNSSVCRLSSKPISKRCSTGPVEKVPVPSN